MNLFPFTVEEENLICIYDITDRSTLISNIKEAVPYFEEPELCEIAESALRKLEVMTDTEFSALTFQPAYHGDDEDDILDSAESGAEV